MVALGFATCEHRIERPSGGRDDVFLDLPDGVGDIADDFDLREIDRIDFRAAARDMNDRRTARLHEKRRLLSITSWPTLTITSALEIARWTKSPADSAAQPRNFGCISSMTPFPSWVVRNGIPVFSTNWSSTRPVILRLAPAPITSNGRSDSSSLRTAARTAFASADGRRAKLAGMGRLSVSSVSDILGKFEMRRARLFLFGEAKGFSYAARYVVATGELMGIFGDRPHHSDHVENLKAALFGFLDGLLASDHQDRHAAQLRIGGRGHQICRAGSECRQTHAGLAGMAAVSPP